jgi:hypothetical protein
MISDLADPPPVPQRTARGGLGDPAGRGEDARAHSPTRGAPITDGDDDIDDEWGKQSFPASDPPPTW